MSSSEYQKNIYESQKEYFDRNKLHDTPRIKQIHSFLDKITKGTNKTILDVGCGGGEIIKKYIPEHEVFGVDISEKFLEIAQKNGIKTKMANLEEGIPFEDHYFDVVLCSEVIEHLVDTDKLLTEINRVLKIDGDLVLTFPNVNSVVSYLMMLILDLPPYLSARYKAPHFRDFTLKTMKMALNYNGFQFKFYRGTSFYLPFLGHMGFIGGLLGKAFPRLSEMIIIHSKKIKDVIYDKNNSFSFDLYKKIEY